MIIVKIGGGKGINVKGIVAGLAKLEDPFIIVHGANAWRDELAEKLGKPKKVVTSVSGYDSVFSDDDAIDTLMMAYAGLRNKRIVEMCQVHGINSVGLSGLDGRLVQGKRNKGIRVKEDGKLKLLRDHSGKPQSINISLLNILLENSYVPVITVPIVDEEGYALNSENDSIINVLQSALKADKIIQFIEAPGFLADAKDEGSLVKKMSKGELLERESQVEGRMKRKMLALRQLFDAGASTVIISDGRVADPIGDALAGKGTVIQ